MPIYQSTSFVFDNSDHAAALFALQQFGNIYTRIMNPTKDVLEQRVASLENGVAGLAMASGQAAQFVASAACWSREIISSPPARCMEAPTLNSTVSFRKFGYDVTFVEPDDPENFRKAISPTPSASMARPSATRAATSWISKRWPRSRTSTSAAGDRQHLRHPLRMQADRLWSRHRAAFADQIHGRPWNSIGGIIVDAASSIGARGKFPRSINLRRPITA